MMKQSALRRGAILAVGGLFVCGVWGFRSIRLKGSDQAPGRLERSESAARRDSPPARTSNVAPASPQEPVPDAVTAKVASRAASSGQEAANDRIDQSLSDLRVALKLHDRALGETVYPVLRSSKGLALERVKALLRDGQDDSDREVAERAIQLLSAPPTHGLLKHFQW